MKTTKKQRKAKSRQEDSFASRKKGKRRKSRRSDTRGKRIDPQTWM
jgi:hypothetical protein